MPRLTLIWPDSEITTGDSWEELEDAIRAEQWRTFPTRFQFRLALRHRARVWAGARIRAIGSSQRFVESLARADMFTIIDDSLTAERGGEDAAG